VTADAVAGPQAVIISATDEAGNAAVGAGDVVTGSITVNPEGTTDFRTVTLPRSFEKPIVIAKPLETTSPGKDGGGVPNDRKAHPRITNVTSTSFDIRVEEWSSNADATHPAANVSYVVVDEGVTTLADGTTIVAGTVAIAETDGFTSVSFDESLSSPVAFSQPQTTDDTDPVSTRNQNIDGSGMEILIENDEKNSRENKNSNTLHATETVGYIAIESGDATTDALALTAGTQGSVTHQLKQITFGDPYPGGFIADMQTTEGTEESYLRYDRRTDTGVQVRVEEGPYDNSDLHVNEAVGYLAWNTSTAAGGTQSNTLRVDTSAPSFGAVSITRTGGDPPLSKGDTFEISAEVTDDGGVESVTADVSALDAER
jgi:hypothetical protein